MKKVEKELINLFYTSVKGKDPAEVAKAKRAIDYINMHFKIISKFTKANHDKIVKELYFNYNNLGRVGIIAMCYRVYVSERTLERYRDRYCAIAKDLLEAMKSSDDWQ